MAMTSNRPYLVRAYYDWIVANDCTPHFVVDAYQADVLVPQSYVTDGQIVLNGAPRAAKDFTMDTIAVSFNTRFGGVPTDIYIPINAILGIYARENGQGMAFEPEDIASEGVGPEGLDSKARDPKASASSKKASSRVGGPLRSVAPLEESSVDSSAKNSKARPEGASEDSSEQGSSEQGSSEQDSSKQDKPDLTPEDEPPTPPSRPGGGHARLRVVK